MLTSLETKLDDIITEVEEAEDSDKAGVLAELLGGDADEYSEYFTNIVEIESEELYAPVAYGAAAFGLLLHKPMRGIIEKVEESKRESDVML